MELYSVVNGFGSYYYEFYAKTGPLTLSVRLLGSQPAIGYHLTGKAFAPRYEFVIAGTQVWSATV
jgi:hypothetical protein